MECIIFLYLFIFFLGLAMGSFLNSIIHRLYTGESFLFTRSYCPYCKHSLGWQDLIPVLSFLTLKGKCRYCKEEISRQYPLVELATGILFVLISISYPVLSINYFFRTCYLLIITCFLIIIFVYDLKHYIIPDEIIYPAIWVAFLYQFFRSLAFENWNLFEIWNLEIGILKPLSSAFLASAFFLAIVLLSKGRWMGGGDIKVAFFMGLFLSFPNVLVALFLAFSIGAIIGIGLILTGKKTLKSKVPFGPFLVTGIFIALFFGNQIVNWYLNILK